MRLPPFPSGVLLAGLAGRAAAGHQHPGDELIGAWSATRWQYTRLDGGGSVDVVCDLGAVMTLGLSEGTWVLSFTIPGRGEQTIGGTWTRHDGMLELLQRGAVEPERLRCRVSRELLSLTSNDSGWDFDGDAKDEPASLTAVFVKL